MKTEIILLTISGVFLGGGVYLWQRGNRLLAIGRKADAVVFSNKRSDSRNATVYFPVVRFLTDKQEWITQELNIGTSPAIPEGTKVQVIYDPDDPTQVEIHSAFRLEILPRLFVGLGVAGLVLVVLEVFDILQLSSGKL